MPTATTVPTIHPGTEVPGRHLVTSIPNACGIYWLYGFRGHDLTARFTLIEERPQVGFSETLSVVVFANADWPTAWKAMAGIRYQADRLEALLNSVLPPVTYT